MKERKQEKEKERKKEGREKERKKEGREKERKKNPGKLPGRSTTSIICFSYVLLHFKCKPYLIRSQVRYGLFL
jgi:hypothetical protein